MIPERLELVAFGPFVAPQAVDLAAVGAHGLFLIHGPTGSGKSTLLDALTFALFGETSGSDRDGADLVATLAEGAEARVALEFRHAGARYRVERTPRQRRRKRRGEGFTDVNPTAALYRLSEAGAATLVADGSAQVTTQVRELLSCDAVQFRQTVVLPQGQFRRVIEDDDTRARTLRDLFDTQRFVELQARLKAYAGHLRTQVQRALVERAALREEHGVPDAEGMATLATAARTALDDAVEAARGADARHAAAIEARSDGKAWAERFAALDATRETLERLSAAAGAIDADRARLAADRAARQAEPAVRGWRDTEADLARRACARDAARETAQAAAALAAEARRAREEHEARRAARDAAQERLRGLEPLADDVGRLAAVRATVSETEAEAGKTAQALADLERDASEAAAAREAADAAVERLEPLAAALPEAQAAEAQAARELRARELLDEAVRDLAQAAPAEALVDLDELWRPLARALATRLEPGAPCPVCGATDHPASVHLADRDEAMAAAHRAVQASQAETLHRSEERARFEQRVASLLEAAGWRPEATPERAVLEAARDRCRERRAGAEGAAADLATQRTLRSDARSHLEELAPQLAAARERLSARRDAATRGAAQLDALLARLDPAHHDPQRFGAELDGARETVAAYDRRAEALATDAARTEKDAAVAEERQGTATKEADAARTRLENARAEAEAALREAGFTTRDGQADADAQAAALLDAAELPAAEARVAAHDHAVAFHARQRDALGEATAGREPPDLAALEGAVDTAQQARDAALATRDTARDALGRLGAALDRWRALDAELESREARQRIAQHLSDLVNGSAKGATKLDLETYVLRRILGDVLGHANVHLQRMTGGRYRLRLRDRADELRARGLELDVEDRHAGGARRRVATLSGGEGFQASLALALGLSEAAERTSGAVELGALFVDEGFGSLDAHALDGVVRILRELPATQNRMVGVITHVDELKRRIEAQLLVIRDGLGSRVEIGHG